MSNQTGTTMTTCTEYSDSEFDDFKNTKVN